MAGLIQQLTAAEGLLAAWSCFFPSIDPGGLCTSVLAHLIG